MGRSESIAALAAALAKAQGEMGAASKDGYNPGFKSHFATLASIWDAARNPLSKNGLSVTQVTYGSADGTPMIETILMHASGEWISGEMALRPIDSKPQSIGSAITYARRYSLAAIVGIAPDDDDDGSAASDKPVQQQPRTQPAYQAPPTNGNNRASQEERELMEAPTGSQVQLATEKQIQMMGILVKELYPKDKDLAEFREWMIGTYHVNSRKDLTVKQASEVIDMLQKTKNGEAA